MQVLRRDHYKRMVLACRRIGGKSDGDRNRKDCSLQHQDFVSYRHSISL